MTNVLSGQTLLLQRVYELELVNFEIAHKAGHEFLEELLEVHEVLVD